MTKKLKLVNRKNQYGEYKIRYYENNKEIEDGAYYTEDLEDAKRTFRLIAKSLQLKYRQIDSLNLYTGKQTFKYMETY